MLPNDEKYDYQDPDGVSKYGYEDPDAPANNKYGYEDPDTHASNKYGYEDPDAPTNNKYGYEDPDTHANNKYGYEDPDAAKLQNQSGSFFHSRQARRSSMKQEGATRTRRRASIQTVGMIEVKLPGQAKPLLRRTSIDFMEFCTVEVPSTVEDPNELSERWISTDEYKKIEHDNNKIVKAIVKGTEKHFCTRGLESQLAKEAHRSKKDSHQAVWEEQSRQKEDGTFDEAILMEKYRLSAIQSKIDAAERAEQDTADIEAYLKSTRKMMRRMSC